MTHPPPPPYTHHPPTAATRTPACVRACEAPLSPAALTPPRQLSSRVRPNSFDLTPKRANPGCLAGRGRRGGGRGGAGGRRSDMLEGNSPRHARFGMSPRALPFSIAFLAAARWNGGPARNQPVEMSPAGPRRPPPRPLPRSPHPHPTTTPAPRQSCHVPPQIAHCLTYDTLPSSRVRLTLRLPAGRRLLGGKQNKNIKHQ